MTRVKKLRWNDIMRYVVRGNETAPRRMERTEEEWKSILTEEEFYITRLKGTEKANKNESCTVFETGSYACKCCGILLFDATEKFNSGTGWPSFTEAINRTHIAYHKDKSFGMTRVELSCNICDAHLGHVFPDGPENNGLRYCVNALSLRKVSNNKLSKGSCGIDRPSNPCGDASDY